MTDFIKFTGNNHEAVYVVPRAVTAIVQRGEACNLVMRRGNGLDINEGADEALRRIDRAN
ncbi:MAG: hypothetical protein AAGK02_05055 [Pseudomonadota bacterium]